MVIFATKNKWSQVNYFHDEKYEENFMVTSLNVYEENQVIAINKFHQRKSVIESLTYLFIF